MFYTKLYHDFSTSYLHVFEALTWEGFCLGGKEALLDFEAIRFPFEFRILCNAHGDHGRYIVGLLYYAIYRKTFYMSFCLNYFCTFCLSFARLYFIIQKITFIFVLWGMCHCDQSAKLDNLCQGLVLDSCIFMTSLRKQLVG